MRTRGAGPRTTLPWKLYCDPWQGHMNLFSFCAAQGTTRQGLAMAARRAGEAECRAMCHMMLMTAGSRKLGAHRVPRDDAAEVRAHGCAAQHKPCISPYFNIGHAPSNHTPETQESPPAGRRLLADHPPERWDAGNPSTIRILAESTPKPTHNEQCSPSAARTAGRTVDAVVLERALPVDDQVGRVALQPLHQRPVACATQQPSHSPLHKPAPPR